MPYKETTAIACSCQPIQIQKEEWRHVAGFEGLYKVSSFGRVLSLSVDKPYCRREQFIKPSTIRGGYKVMHLSRDGLRDAILLHRLVLRTFVGDSDLQGNHKNGIKADNALVNLEYVTPTENMRHRRDVLGIKQRMPPIPFERRARGERHWSAKHPELYKRGDEHWTRKYPEKVFRGAQQNSSKLTAEKVLAIREMYTTGKYKQRELAAIFSVSQRTIWYIIHRHQWKHV